MSILREWDDAQYGRLVLSWCSDIVAGSGHRVWVVTGCAVRTSPHPAGFLLGLMLRCAGAHRRPVVPEMLGESDWL
jgi:hypothetical protein